MIQLIVVIALVGLILWAVNSFIPMQAQVKTILNVVVVIGLVLWILEATGLLHGAFRVPR
jgi:hypothetical protein